MKRTLLQRAILTAAVLILHQVGIVPASAQAAAVQCRDSNFLCGGKTIRLELFLPTAKVPIPALVLVPESKGMNSVGPVYRAIAARMAEDGFAVVLVHFFDRTEHKNGVDPKAIKPQDFKDWVDTVAACVRHVRKMPGVQKDQVGLIGFSLGGFLALSAASEKKLGVKAVASYFGGIPDELWPQVTFLPPTMVVHGTRDDIVHVRNAYAVIGFCAAKKVPHQCKIYAEGHLFENALRAHVLGAKALQLLGIGPKVEMKDTIALVLRENAMIKDAVQTTMGFFRVHLGLAADAKIEATPLTGMR